MIDVSTSTDVDEAPNNTLVAVDEPELVVLPPLPQPARAVPTATTPRVRNAARLSSGGRQSFSSGW